MNVKLLATYAATLATLSDLLVANKAESATENAARDARKGGLVDTLRLLAVETHRDGVPAKDASDMLRLTLSLIQDDEGKAIIPGGTVKNYCAAIRGYHVMLTQGRDISEVSTKDATDEVASEETKAIKAAKEEFSKLTKKYTAAQWRDLVALVTPAAPVAEEASTEEVEDVEQEARKAG